MGRDVGVTSEQIEDLHAYEESSAFTERERLALRLADAMSDTPANVGDALFRALRAHYSDVELVELCSAIAWENYRARFNRVFDVGSEDFSEGAFCPLPTG